MRDSLLLYINGRRHDVRGRDAFASLSDFLRLTLGQIGTKIVCSEGDCGACTVFVGRPLNGKIDYRIVNSCIQFLYQLDGAHIVTVEGLQKNGALTPMQEAMIANHGSQCGFCTPGFVVALTSLADRGQNLSRQNVVEGLTGNLCRCTGYLPILTAAMTQNGEYPNLHQLYPDPKMLRDLEAAQGQSVYVRSDGAAAGSSASVPVLHGPVEPELAPPNTEPTSAGRQPVAATREFLKATTLQEAAAFKRAKSACMVIAGGTDVGVRMNKGLLEPTSILSLSSIPNLSDITEQNGTITAGALATWSTFESFVKDKIPQLYQIMILFGSPQIRNAGTIGGNIANASPIADSLPFLFVAGAQLELISPAGSRLVPIDQFYKGYKLLDLEPDELIARVLIPVPTRQQTLKLYKVSRRRNLDISSFTAAFLATIQDNTIRAIRIAYGGVGPVVLRLLRTEALLTNKPLTEDLMHEAALCALAEITPITDVRGTQKYRNLLAENILMKFFHDVTSAPSPAAI